MNEVASEPVPSLPKRHNGREPFVLKYQEIEDAAAIGLTVTQIASVMGIGRSTLFLHFQNDPEAKDAYDRGRDRGDALLYQSQFKRAMAGSDTMLIWLGKNRLNQTDKTELSGVGGGPIEVADVTPIELARRVAYLLASAASE